MDAPILSTLMYVIDGDHVLMLHRIKKHQDINAGKWIGIGGKNERGESFDACVKRECYEETGLTIDAMTPKGMLTFISDDYLEYIMVFTSTAFTGSINRCCDEGVLQWVAIDSIASLELWQGDRYFLPKLFEDGPFFNMTLIYHHDELKHVECDGSILMDR